MILTLGMSAGFALPRMEPRGCDAYLTLPIMGVALAALYTSGMPTAGDMLFLLAASFVVGSYVRNYLHRWKTIWLQACDTLYSAGKESAERTPSG
jgi:hypothetical protein